jgi:hypothetical protein
MKPEFILTEAEIHPAGDTHRVTFILEIPADPNENREKYSEMITIKIGPGTKATIQRENGKPEPMKIAGAADPAERPRTLKTVFPEVMKNTEQRWRDMFMEKCSDLPLYRKIVTETGLTAVQVNDLAVKKADGFNFLITGQSTLFLIAKELKVHFIDS